MTNQPSTADMIRTAATIRKAASYPKYTGTLEAHTSGMAELIAHLTGRQYSGVRSAIVAAERADQRTTLQASQALVRSMTP